MKFRVVGVVARVALLSVSLLPGQLAAQSNPRGEALAALGRLSESFEALSARVSPAVVQIIATGYAPLGQATPSGVGLLSRRQVGGSGVILDPNGYIITNAHVVAGAGRVQVRLPIPASGPSDGTSILKPKGKIVGAQVVGIDRETDLAVLRVAESGLPFLRLGDSDELRQGQLVFAFGSPLGLENSVSMGVVSAVGRQLRPDDPMIYIQTDAPINPGNSGGPLVDTDGRVMGISTFIISQSGGSEGLGFAAPSNIVRTIFEQIKNSGYVSRGIIGVNAQTITPTLAAGIGLSRDWGVVIGDVYPGSPAQQAGLQIGDQILSLEGRTMENGRQFEVNLYGRPVGQTATLEILRGTERFTVRVPVIERPGAVESFAGRVTPEKNLVRRLGILALDLTPSTEALLPKLRGTDGVVVAALSPGPAYGLVDLQAGDVIYKVNNQPVADLDALRRILDGVQRGEALVLQVERRGELMFLAFEIE